MKFTKKLLAVLLSILLVMALVPSTAFVIAERGDYTGANVDPATGEEIDPPPHNHMGGTATCHTKAICTVCGEEYGEFDPNNHDGETEIRNVKDASCTETGYTGDTYCLGCGAKIAEGESIPATAHTPGNPVRENVVNATCEADGSYDVVVYCTVCRTEISRTPETIYKLGHDYEEVVTPPTCTERGFTTHTCKRCRNSFVDNYVDALGHTGGTATCHTKAKCAVCGEEYGEFDPSNHEGETEIRNKKAATCTEAGYTGDTYCLGCGAKIADGESILATGHNIGEWENDATEHWHVCSVCTNEVDKAAHTFEWFVTRVATKEQNGLKEEICSVCGYKSGNSEEIVYFEEHVPGDINGDSVCNNMDLATLFQYVSDWDVPVNEAALDVNGDGMVSNGDCITLFQYLSGWNVTIH